MRRIDIMLSGGCQCGAVRYTCTALLDNAHICHCRMCQKAVGGPFAALVGAPQDALIWTRGEPSEYFSSDYAARGFCALCGTPLYYRGLDAAHTSLTIGSLDEPLRAPPARQMGMEGAWPHIDAIGALPDAGATEVEAPDDAARIARSNHQHPDYDTADWPQ